jgi:hypothetical protein
MAVKWRILSLSAFLVLLLGLYGCVLSGPFSIELNDLHIYWVVMTTQ